MKKVDLDEYNTRTSSIKNFPFVSANILRLGMTKHTFQMLVGNFEDFDSKTKFGDKTLSEYSIATKNFEVKPLCTPEKKDVLYYDANLIGKDLVNITAMNEVLNKNAIFFAMVAHMLQTIRLKYPFVELDCKYQDANRFGVHLIYPIKDKQNQINYYRIKLEFLNGDTPAKDDDGVKILCYRSEELTQSMTTKINVLLQQHDNVIFAFYNEFNYNLPLFCTQKGDFKGESIFFSSLFTRMLKKNAKENEKLNHDLVFKKMGNAIDEEHRLFDVTIQDKKEGSFIKITDKTIPDFLKKSIYYNIPFNLTTEECMLINHALARPTISNLEIADEIGFEKKHVKGIFSYLIQRTNEVINDDVIHSRILLEQENQKKALTESDSEIVDLDFENNEKNIVEHIEENNKEDNEENIVDNKSKDNIKDNEENMNKDNEKDSEESIEEDINENNKENINESSEENIEESIDKNNEEDNKENVDEEVKENNEKDILERNKESNKENNKENKKPKGFIF